MNLKTETLNALLALEKLDPEIRFIHIALSLIHTGLTFKESPIPSSSDSSSRFNADNRYKLIDGVFGRKKKMRLELRLLEQRINSLRRNFDKALKRIS